MSDGIDVPIKLPTDSASVRAAAGVVKSLEAQLAALGPAAAAGSAQAQAAMRSLGAAADAAQRQVVAAKARDAARAALPRGPVRNADEAKARAVVEAAAGKAAVGALDADRRAAAAAEKGRAKEVAAAAKAAAKDVAKEEKAAAKARVQAAKEAEKAEKAAAKEKAAAAKKTATEAKKAAAEQKKTADKAKAGNDALAKSYDDALGKVGMAVAGAMVAITLAGAAAAVSFSVALVKIQAFKESTINAFGKLLGGAKAADAAFKASIKTADDLGLGYRETLSSVNALLAQGFKVDAAQTLVKAMADLKSVNPAANIESIVNAVSKIKATGKLQGDELNMLNEAGLSASLVYEALAKQMGKTVPEIQAMQRAGKLGADEVIKAILAGIQATTKMPIGEAAKQASNSLQGLLTRVSQLPEGLLMAADAGKGMDVIKDVLRNLLGAFAPSTASGKALAAALGKLGNAFASMLSGLTGKGGAEKVQSFVEGLTAMISRLGMIFEGLASVIAPVIGGLVNGLGEGMKAGDKFFGGAERGTANAAKLAPSLEKIGNALGFLVGGFMAAVGALAQANASIDQFAGYINKIGGITVLLNGVTGLIQGFATDVFVSAVSIGFNLIQGIITGMSGGLPGLLGAVASVAGATTGAAKSGFGTHSPSVIWRDEIGYQLPAGGAEGIESGGKLMKRSASKLAANTNAAAVSAIGGGASKQAPSIGELHFHGMTRSDADFFEARTRTLFAELAAA